MADTLDPKQLKQITDAIANGFKTVGAQSSRNNTQRPTSTHAKASEKRLEGAALDVKDLIKKNGGKMFATMVAELSDGAGKFTDNIHKYDKGLQGFSKNMSAYAQMLMESSELSNKALDEMTSNIKKKVGESGDELSKHMYSYARTVDDVKTAHQKAARIIEEYRTILDHANGTTLDSIKTTDKFDAAIEALEATFGLLDDEARKDMEALVVRAKQYDAAALKEIDDKMKAMAITHDSTNAVIASSAAQGVFRTEIAKTWKGFVEATPIAKMVTLGGSFALLSDGIKGLITQFNAVKEAGFQNSLWALNKDSVMLGSSVEALTAVLNDNKAAMNKAGMDKFIESMSESQLSLMKLGMSTEQANKFFASTMTSAHDAGLALNSIGEQKEMIDAQSKAYAALRATTNITAEGFIALNKELTNSTAAQNILASMDQKQKAGYVKGIALEQQRLTQLGITVDQQKEIIAATTEILAQTVKSRIDTAGKVQQAAGLLGMGQEGSRAAQIIRKGKGATEDERKELQEIAIEMKRREDKLQGSGSILDQNKADVAAELTDGPLAKLIDSGRAVNQAQQAGLAKTDEQTKQLVANGEVSKVMTQASLRGAQAMAILSSPLTHMALGVVGLGLSLKLLMGGQNKTIMAIDRSASRIVNAIKGGTGKGGFDDMFDSFSGKGGKGSKFSRYGKIVAAGKGGRLSAGARFMGKASNLAGKVKLGGLVKGAGIVGTAVGIGSSLMTSAKDTDMSSSPIGAAMSGIGAFAAGGPWGLAIAAGISGLIGAFKGFQKAGEFFGTEAPTMGQKIASGIGGLLNGLTFGLISGEGASKAVYKLGEYLEPVGHFLMNLGKIVFAPWIMAFKVAKGTINFLIDHAEALGKMFMTFFKFTPLYWTFQLAKKSIEGLVLLADVIGDAISDWWDDFTKPWIELFGAIDSGVEDMGKSIDDMGDWLESIPEKIFGSIANWYNSIIDEAKGFLSKFGLGGLVPDKIDTGTTPATATATQPTQQSANTTIGADQIQTDAMGNVIQADSISTPPPRQIQGDGATINTQLDNAATNTQVAAPGTVIAPAVAPATKSIAQGSSVAGKEITISDMFDKLAELVDLSKIDHVLSKEQISALKSLKSAGVGAIDYLQSQ